MKRAIILLAVLASVASAKYYKGIAGKVYFYSWDTANNVPKTGDAGQMTAYVSIDGAAEAALADTSLSEIDATNAPGSYVVDVAAAEMNGEVLHFSCKSGTASIYIAPQTIAPDPNGIQVAFQTNWATTWDPNELQFTSVITSVYDGADYGTPHLTTYGPVYSATGSVAISGLDDAAKAEIQTEVADALTAQGLSTDNVTTLNGLAEDVNGVSIRVDAVNISADDVLDAPITGTSYTLRQAIAAIIRYVKGLSL